MQIIQKLKITAFISGFVLMVFELVGMRVLAPFLGSSAIIWTSLIGVILIFMSLGYYYGGQIADRYVQPKILGVILLLAAGSIMIMTLIKNPLLGLINGLALHLIMKSLLACAFLFGPTSFLLALVSPVAVKFSIKKNEHSGRAIGAIYAFSAIGSILGTFIGGYILISLIGTNGIIYGLSFLIFLTSFLFTRGEHGVFKLIIGLMLLGYSLVFLKEHDYIDLDTNYARLLIYNSTFEGKEVKFLQLNGYVNSGMNVHSPNELLFEYTRFYDVFSLFVPRANTVLLIGGGAFSYPKHFQEKYPKKALDVVEIDPELLEISKAQFEFEQGPNTQVFLEDARYFLQNGIALYDVVLYDVLTSPLSAPFHLTTKEAFQQISERMHKKGVLILNFLADMDGPSRAFLASELKTIATVFPQVNLYSAQKKSDAGLRNYMVIASKSGEPLQPLTNNLELLDLLGEPITFKSQQSDLVVTDDFAPIDYLMAGY